MRWSWKYTEQVTVFFCSITICSFIHFTLHNSCLPVWNLHLIPESECCSTPHTYTHTIMPMADVCHRYLHARRSWPPGSGQLLLEDDLCSMSSTWPEQCQQGRLTAEKDVFRAWHPRSPSLWQWPTICKCPVYWLLYILGHNTCGA